MKFQTILIDPPWDYQAWSDKGSHHTENHYSCMDFAALCNLRLEDIADRDCTLLMWTTPPMLKTSFDVIAAWNERIGTEHQHKSGKPIKNHQWVYKTKFDWVKTGKNGKPKPATGRHCWGVSEPLLVFQRRTSCIPPSHCKPYGAFFDRVGRHSQKPLRQYELAEGYVGPYVEVFARPNGQLDREGWTFIGQEITGNDISVDIDCLRGAVSSPEMLHPMSR